MAKKAQIAYRGNSLLDKDVPTIARALQEAGYEVRTQRFEQGTKGEVMYTWVDQNLKGLAACDLVLSDETCGDICRAAQKATIYHPEKQVEKLKFPDERPTSLDDIIGKVINGTLFREIAGRELQPNCECEDEIFDDKGVERAKILAQYKQAFLSVLGKVKQLPKKAFILESHIADHTPFRDCLGSNNAKETLASWFGEAGVAEVKVIEDEQKLPNEDKNQGNWVVVDRHTQCYSVEGYVTLQVPFGNFLQGVTKLGLIQGVDYSGRLAEYVKERFGEKPQATPGSK